MKRNGPMFLWGAYGDPVEAPEFMCWAPTREDAEEYFGPHAFGRTVERVTQGQLVLWRIQNRCEKQFKHTAISNYMKIDTPYGQIRFLG